MRPSTIATNLGKEALRCEKLFSESPLAGYDLPEEANDFRYWAKLAVESGDPIAVIDRAWPIHGQPSNER